ncbi:hypothetical protein BCL90_2630 [Pedobacter alluvionis]|uniref:Uncharacterized protein n=1 Tax=Pedobacter alluvionis TaxID=475253 RepID=A0A497YBI6_9SPHI|nr:hypothetical protein BCL90_2630 [Pedobacter alluvionis]
MRLVSASFKHTLVRINKNFEKIFTGFMENRKKDHHY